LTFEISGYYLLNFSELKSQPQDYELSVDRCVCLVRVAITKYYRQSGLTKFYFLTFEVHPPHSQLLAEGFLFDT
jgi:hypothetical protein